MNKIKLWYDIVEVSDFSDEHEIIRVNYHVAQWQYIIDGKIGLYYMH